MLTNSNSRFVSLLAMVILVSAATQAAAQAGQLDPTFGNGGIAITDFGAQYQQDIAAVGGVAIQTDGKIVVGHSIRGGQVSGTVGSRQAVRILRPGCGGFFIGIAFYSLFA